MICPIHGHQAGEGIVCLPCFAIQTERVERESLPLRTANTSEALRARVLASGNGHSPFPRPTMVEIGDREGRRFDEDGA
jgi:hypothetical protein